MPREPPKQGLQVGVRLVIRQCLANGKTESDSGLVENLIKQFGYGPRSAASTGPDRQALGDCSTHGGVIIL